MPIIIRAPSALFSRTKRLCTLPLTPRVFHLNDHKRIRLIYMKNCTKREATSAICDTEIEINHVSSIFARRHCRRNHLKYTRKWREEKNNIYPLTHVSDCVCVCGGLWMWLLEHLPLSARNMTLFCVGLIFTYGSALSLSGMAIRTHTDGIACWPSFNTRHALRLRAHVAMVHWDLLCTPECRYRNKKLRSLAMCTTLALPQYNERFPHCVRQWQNALFNDTHIRPSYRCPPTKATLKMPLFAVAAAVFELRTIERVFGVSVSVILSYTTSTNDI